MSLINSDNKKVMMKPKDSNNSRTLLNGHFVTEETEVHNGDRMVLGHGNAWRVFVPGQGEIKEAGEDHYNSVLKDRLNSDSVDAVNIRA